MKIPDHFDPTLTMKQSAARHGVSESCIFNWRKKLGYIARTDLWTEDDLRRLRSMYSGQSIPDIASALGRTVSAVKTKAIALGLRRATGHFAPDRAPVIRGRVTGHADMAAQHLQRIAPVFRVDADGKANPKGKCWRFGTIVLTEDEMIGKAERKGWNADAWREIPRSGSVTIGEAVNGVLSRMQVAG